MGQEDELERLAARGREIRARELAAKSTPSDEAVATRKRTRVAVSRYARWGWVLVALLTGGAAFAIVSFGKLSPWTSQDDVIDAIGLGTVGVALAICFLLRAPIAERAIAREEAWARSLPFPLSGHPAALGAATTEGRFVLELTFRGPDAQTESATATFRASARANADIDDALVADALRTIGATVAPGPGPLDRRIETTFEYEESTPMTNAHACAWVHRAISALGALHARHPIAAVEVRGFAR